MTSESQQNTESSFQLSFRFLPELSSLHRAFLCIFRCRVVGFLALLAVSLAGLFLTSFWLSPTQSESGRLIFNLLIFLSLSILIISFYLIWIDLLKPVLDIEEWSQQMRSGNLDYKTKVPKYGELSKLTEDLNDLGTMMNHLAKDTEEQLHHHTKHTELKTQSLGILYDVAASINISSSLDDLLKRFLRTLTEVLHANAGAVRLLNKDDQMELMASIGFDEELIEKERLLPTESCVCGKVENCDDLIFQDSVLPCNKKVGHQFFGSDQGLIVVPLQYQGKTLGVYNLFVHQDIYKQKNNSDYKELFTSIGRHLGMAIAKARLDEESTKVSIMHERNRLAFELHDSLAQTLASMRLQVRVLDEIMHSNDEAASWQQLERIESTVDEANTELRGLIAHFQAPIRKQALIPAVQDIVKRFRTESDIHIFFQHTINNPLKLSDKYHLEVIRIIQEALNNLRKHSEANVARIMIRQRDTGRLHILIEDDGIGLQTLPENSKPGEQIGLKSMKERASRLKADFAMESEPGEGTRIILEFDLNRAQSTQPSVKIDTSFNLI
ncbi:MAG: histidine kinase [Gammaproteobacteria bacterium]|mgnify:CR=1 FL=1|jgi:two-component system nitrate/nitrite sensor histidine kinase NarX|nr:histidine kinase [Gammaproteobacteria bacterium]MBT3721968.1 histidine kinase [Gammaproteobacteria bacterium]MBT4078831.1 histidine kinase [Gammaproteobacteria bacterium]MBT4193265.1 histidine kinase [Gammaproteobacteria bacterium]MBT4451298.1 histidine kinase [Gammaproteobacteria bacterium]